MNVQLQIIKQNTYSTLHYVEVYEVSAKIAGSKFRSTSNFHLQIFVPTSHTYYIALSLYLPVFASVVDEMKTVVTPNSKTGALSLTSINGIVRTAVAVAESSLTALKQVFKNSISNPEDELVFILERQLH